MVPSFVKTSVLYLNIFLFTATIALAQSYQDTDYRRLSLSINGGINLGDQNNGNYFMSSNFSGNTEHTAAFGAGLQYALTPAWSLELGYRYSQIKGITEPFETSLNLITLKNFINLNQLFFVNRISSNLNPFLTAGIGYDLYNYRGPTEDFYNYNSSYNIGAGIAFKLSNTIDLFTHYEYHVGSNAIDNATEGFGADLINSVTGGLRINFGKKESKHPSWRPVPVELSPSDYNRFMAQSNSIDEMNQRMDKIDQRNDESTRRYEKVIQEHSTEIDSLKSRLNRLTKRVDDLENAFANLQSDTTKLIINESTGFAELLPGGHYVQIFATYQLEIAQNVRKLAIESLEGQLQNADEKIFIIKRKQFYEVMIGVFNDFNQAQDVQEVMTQSHTDAYVITFPRPVNLMTDFEDLKVVH